MTRAADSTTSRPARTTHRADIQGLRAVAVILVVLFHAHLGFSGGFVGVDVFFVISGFVITTMLMPGLTSTDTIALGTFYLRRMRRLIPALALVVVVVSIVGIVAAPVGIQQIGARTGAAASVFLGNAYLYLVPKGYFTASSDLNPFLHMWSLAVEEQFYLVFPVLLLASWKLGARRRRGAMCAIVCLSAVGAVSLLLAIEMVDGHSIIPGISSPREFAFYSSITRAWEFAAGALLAFGATKLRNLAPTMGRVAAWLGLALVMGAALSYDAQTLFPGLAAIPPVVGTVLILGAGVRTDTGANRWLGIRPLVFIGDISYSWYLWHWPLIVYARAVWPGSFSAPVAAFASLLPAWLSYRFVENPIRFSRRATPSRTLVLAGGAIALALMASASLVVGNRFIQRSAAYRSVRVALEGHRACPSHDAARRDLTANDPEVASRCTWTVPGSQGTIALLGDSNAGHIVEPVVKAARAEQRSVYVATSNGCPFVDVTMVLSGERQLACRRFYESSVRIITDMHPGLVVIGSSTPKYLAESRYALVAGPSGAAVTTPAGKAVVWRQAVRRTVEALAHRGIPVLLVHSVPKYPGWDLRGCAAGRVVLAEFTCGASTSRPDAVRAGAPAHLAEDAAIRGIRGAHAIDFLPQLCSRTTCATSRGLRWMYHDGDHLSVKGSLELVPRFERAFSTIASE